MKKLLLALAVLFTASLSHADLLGELKDNTKLKFISSSQLGYAWDLTDETAGPIALLDLLQYRFIVLGAGWTNSVPNDLTGAVVATAGVHVDKLARTISPGASDVVRDIVPAIFRPVWDRLTFSYGPGYNFDSEKFTHLIAVNFQFE